MTNIENLRGEYPGDQAWANFVSAICPHEAERTASLAGVGDPSIAAVVIAELNDGALAWLKQPLVALDGRSPSDVLQFEPSGAIVVRSFLMRMPR